MKKAFFSLVALTIFSLNTYAYKIIIDVEGKGSVTFEPNGGNPKYTFNCEAAPTCCGSLTIEMPDKQGIYDPTDIIGAEGTLIECEGTKDNVKHKWQGTIRAVNHNSSNPNFLQVVFSNAIQLF